LGPIELSLAFAQSDPKQVVLTGGVDPVWHGLDAALDEMERQVKELGAVSIKFYQYQRRGCAWRADDRDIACLMEVPGVTEVGCEQVNIGPRAIPAGWVAGRAAL
jgi:hypothetical protein